ncbi:transcriptional regulator, LysR family [Pseudooceanicola nitratireducens]|uniref:Transcriptional regulator, LysR family n=2 Tax=Pseudooceanicola nitratireducens TaxID=517719 RepID=A0A1I1Q8Q4_9RHOB|nr:DNA-binding transcriptional regulator, LysR family [Pseudooceanicola nitratireducens]SFD18377.1 transcriptional regulator, LysR family [Pseudooceanicola nitratireducens]
MNRFGFHCCAGGYFNNNTIFLLIDTNFNIVNRYMAITFRQLEYFLALSEELHFGNAARKLNISQPPLSASLRQLEETLGFALMIRSNRSVRLTEAGAVFAKHAARLLHQLQQAETIAAQTAKGTSGTLSVGFVPSMLFRRLPEILSQFQEAYPKVDLILQEMNTAGQIDLIEHHQLDVGFIHGAPLPDQVQDHLLETERLVCCLPRGHRLAGRSKISIQQLSGEKVIVFERAYAEYNYDRIAELLAEGGMKPNDGYKLRNWFTVVTLVSQGMGVALVPQSLSRMDYGDVSYAEIDGPAAEHRVSMICHADSGNEVLREFLRFVKASDMAHLPSLT